MNESEPKMRKFKVSVSTGYVGCDREDTFEIEETATENEISEAAQEVLFNMIEWGYTEIEPGDDE